MMEEENKRKAEEAAIERAEAASSEGKAFCILHVDIGSDAKALREAVVKVMAKKKMAVMVFSTDKNANKTVACAGVPEDGDKNKLLKVVEWLNTALNPLKGKGGGGKGGIGQGQGPDTQHLEEAIDVAASFASLKLS